MTLELIGLDIQIGTEINRNILKKLFEIVVEASKIEAVSMQIVRVGEFTTVYKDTFPELKKLFRELEEL